MRHALLSSVCLCLVTSVTWSQDERANDDFRSPSRLVYENGNQLLSAGSQAMRTGDYDQGIELTLRGLEQRGNSDYLRTSALSNLCGAYAATRVPDAAIDYCSQSLEVDSKNWRAYVNRAYAHWLKGMHVEAASDLDAAEDINPRASEIGEIRGLINQSTLEPRVRVEDRQ